MEELPEDEMWVPGFEGKYSFTKDDRLISHVNGRKALRGTPREKGGPPTRFRLQFGDNTGRTYSVMLLQSMTWRPDLLTPQENERWIPGYEGRYTASREGFVYSYVVGYRRRLRSHLDRNRPRVELVLTGEKRIVHHGVVSRAVWAAWNGAIEEGMEVLHKDFNRSNNHLDNLYLVTKEERAKLFAKMKRKERIRPTFPRRKREWYPKVGARKPAKKTVPAESAKPKKPGVRGNPKLSPAESQRLHILRRDWGVSLLEIRRMRVARVSDSLLSLATRGTFSEDLPEPSQEAIDKMWEWWEQQDHVGSALRAPQTTAETILAQKVIELQEELKRLKEE
jgi:hypothetical protein